jgi:predicted SprT family Zn-dependent metalloprotease
MPKTRNPQTVEQLLSQSSIVPSNIDNPIAITRVEYDAQQKAFEYLNETLFDGALPNVAIVYSRRAHSGGHFAPDRFTYRGDAGGREHELSLNPDSFTGRSDEWIVSSLLHEMVHLWQHRFGTKKRKNYAYHDKEWAAKMEALGLMPSNSGMVGGKRTGQRMDHYILPGGAYQQAFKALAATGWKLNLQSTIVAGGAKALPSKVKFTCPDCGSNVWGKPETKDICGECNQWRTAPAGDGDIGSYDGEVAPELAAE